MAAPSAAPVHWAFLCLGDFFHLQSPSTNPVTSAPLKLALLEGARGSLQLILLPLLIGHCGWCGTPRALRKVRVLISIPRHHCIKSHNSWPLPAAHVPRAHPFIDGPATWRQLGQPIGACSAGPQKSWPNLADRRIGWRGEPLAHQWDKFFLLPRRDTNNCSQDTQTRRGPNIGPEVAGFYLENVCRPGETMS